MNTDILTRLAHYSQFAYGQDHGSLEDREKAVIEIANFFIQELSKLISKIIEYAKINREVDIVVWGLDGNPIGALFVHSMFYEDSRLLIAVTFDGLLIGGTGITDPLYCYNKVHGLPPMINQMKADMIIDTKVKMIESIDDKIRMPFPLDLTSFFRFMEQLGDAAKTAKIPPSDSKLIFDLSQLGRNIQ